MKYAFTLRLAIATTILISCLVQSAVAQQNGGMEIWSPSGSPPPFDWKYPSGWTTNNATTEFTSAGVSRSTDEHTGNYAAQLRTLNVFGPATRSQMALGNCKLDFPHYQLLAYTGGEPLPMIPQQISFFYKLTTDNALEYAVVDILIKRGNGSSIPDTVFHHSLPLQPIDVYSEVPIPIPGNQINLATDSIVIMFASNDTNEAGMNVLLIDDVVIEFATATEPVFSAANGFTIYPNPVRSGTMLTLTNPEPWKALQIMDDQGRVVRSSCDVQFENDLAQLGPMQLNSGLYSLLLDGRYTGRFVVIE